VRALVCILYVVCVLLCVYMLCECGVCCVCECGLCLCVVRCVYFLYLCGV